MNLNGRLSYEGNVSGSLGAELVADVEANPSEPATQTLVKIRVGDVIYSIPTGGGGGGVTSYSLLTDKPKINNHTIDGEMTAADLDLQDKIVFPEDGTKYLDGEGNFTTPPYISSYNDLSNKPMINGVVLTGDKTSDDLDLSNKAHVNELSGASVDFQNGQELPLLKCIADIEPVQSGSGTPSPDNIRPITGWTDVTITVSNDDETETYTAALGQTVYGGTLDVVSGVLTVDRVAVDMGALNWVPNGMAYGMYEYGITISDKANGATNMICSAFHVQASSAPYCMRGRSASNFVSVISSETTTEAFKVAVNGFQLVYELATPQTVQLTPQKVRSILGQNYIEANTGDIDIIYINNVNDPVIEYILNNL